MSAAILRTLLGISASLERAGVPPLSPYWRGEAERFYGHPTARVLVECVGRGGDKSRTSVMMAIAEVLAGDFVVPPGERHYFTHVSENRDEAAKTLGILERYLPILDVPADRSGDTIELRDLPRGFKVLACRVGAVSGWRAIGWTADENAKWASDGVDPSAEIVASIRAMTVTHPSARGRRISTPLGTVGDFYEAWHRGDADDQVVGHAASWEANPGAITEAQTHELERDRRKHDREYRAIPSEGSEESMFEAALLDRAMRAEPGDVPPEGGTVYYGAMDPSLGRNAWTFCIAARRRVAFRERASIVLAREWRAPRGGPPFDPATILQQIARTAADYGVRSVLTDMFHAESLSAIANRLALGIRIAIDKPTAAERLERYEAVATRLLDDDVELPRHPQLRSDLLAVQRRLTPAGFTVVLPLTSDGRHADYAPAVTLALSRVPPARRPRSATVPRAPRPFIRWEDRTLGSHPAGSAEWGEYGGEGYAPALARHIGPRINTGRR